MTLPAGIAAEAQKLACDRLVRLYEIDATDIGGTIFRFTSSVDSRLSLDTLTHTGFTAELTTATPHQLETGDSLRVVNANDAAYNGDFTVTVVSATELTYNTLTEPAGSAGGDHLAAYRLNRGVFFDGNEYTPIEMDLSGIEFKGRGPLPTPKFLVSNKHQILLSAVIALRDLRDATFTRIRTFRKHLDDGTDPDPTLVFPREIYIINQKTVQNKVFMEFELKAAIDQQGVKIPANICLKNNCLHRYRRYDADTLSFDYSRASCPYTGSTYFKRDGTSTVVAAEDVCGKHLSDCIKRFGQAASLPIRATPGIGGL